MLDFDSKLRYWFTGLDDSYPFELYQVCLHTASVHTSLIPIVLHTGLSENKMRYLDKHDIQHYFVKPNPGIPHSCFPGALLRMYIPVVARVMNLTGTVLYTDSDVIFLNDPPSMNVEYVGASSYHIGVPPRGRHTGTRSDGLDDVMNSGVLYLNVDSLYQSFDEFLQYAIVNPQLHNAAAESIYGFFYDITDITCKLNYFACWGVSDTTIPTILHFWGPKPNVDKHCHTVHSLLTPTYYKNRDLWRAIRNVTRIND